MKIEWISIPKTIKLDDNQFLFGTEWVVTVSGVDNLKEIVLWCQENYEDIAIRYYRSDSTSYGYLNVSKIADHIPHSVNKANNIDIRFKDDTDMMAFKLRWME